MFTGLIEAVGEVVGSAPAPGGARVTFRSPLARELQMGDSIAVNGVCLTVTAREGDVFAADAGPETLRVTTVGAFRSGILVNLERPLKADTRMGGHFVLGHVDAVGRIAALRPEADFMWLRVAFPPDLAPAIVHKGSIAVDGISLTVAALADPHFDVQVVPYTMEHTNLQASHVGDPVNLETDIIGKYVARARQFDLDRSVQS